MGRACGVLVILPAAIPGPGRGLELRVPEVGLRNVLGQGRTAVRVRVRNDSPEPLRGSVSVELSQPRPRFELRVSSSDAPPAIDQERRASPTRIDSEGGRPVAPEWPPRERPVES